MKGKLLFVLCLFLLMSFLVYSRFNQTVTRASSDSPVHDLNTGLNYTTIQEAIDANETVNGDTIKVDSGIYYESINVNKSLTLVGENENTTILDGNGTGIPIGYGAHAIIWLNANGISILNLTIRNAGLNNVLNGPGHYDACISCIGKHDIAIKDNILQNAGAGIVCGNGVSSVTINNNTISSTTGLAIDVGGTTSPTATNVTINNNFIYNVTQLGAINLDGDTSNCTVSNNTVTSCPEGIGLGGNGKTGIAPTNVTISNNVINNATSTGGININGDTSNCTISNNTVENSNPGISLSSTYFASENVTLYNNLVSNCSDDGIGFYGPCHHNSIINNTVENCNVGIWLGPDPADLRAPFDNFVEGNSLFNNNYTNLGYMGASALGQTQESYTNVFRENNLTNVQHFNLKVWGYNPASFMQDIDTSNMANNKRIYYLTNRSNLEVDPSSYPNAGSLALVNCTDVTVRDFNFPGNDDGILLAGSTGCTLTNVTLANNQVLRSYTVQGPDYGGVALVYSSNNTVVNSRISNNTVGVWLCWSDGNTFYDNAFLDNNHQVISGFSLYGTASTCAWNSTVEGNYWSDYNGSDVNQDGIGDTPYVIDSNNLDLNPLMGIFNSFNVTPLYSVETVCNSTVSNFRFNGTAISFNASGENGTMGFCRICIPTALINGTFMVFVNGTEIPCTLLPESNSTQSYLHFTYHHSTQEVIIAPEFRLFLILPFFLIATLLPTIMYRKRLTRTT